MYSYGSPHTAAQKQDNQHERTFSSYVRIQVVVLKTCLGRWTIGRSGERGSGISVLPARYDDDDDDEGPDANSGGSGTKRERVSSGAPFYDGRHVTPRSCCCSMKQDHQFLTKISTKQNKIVIILITKNLYLKIFLKALCRRLNLFGNKILHINCTMVHVNLNFTYY